MPSASRFWKLAARISACFRRLGCFGFPTTSAIDGFLPRYPISHWNRLVASLAVAQPDEQAAGRERHAQRALEQTVDEHEAREAQDHADAPSLPRTELEVEKGGQQRGRRESRQPDGHERPD